MIFYISSTDPNNYNTVKFSTNALTGNDKLEFRINQLTTIAAFLITTHDDYIVFETNSSYFTFHFHDRNAYDRDTLASELTTKFTLNDTTFTVSDNEQGTLTITSTNDFKIKEASHRVKVLLGLYNTELPTAFTQSYTINSVPYTCYGNNLYLKSRISNIVGFNDSMNKEIYISLCYHVYELFYPNMPIICRFPGNYIKIKPTDLTNLEFTLVDFQNEPIVLKAPLNIVMEVTSIN